MIASLSCGVADGWEEAAAFLTGAATVEELSEEVMERFATLRDHPLDLNAAARGRLLSSGLLSAFQTDAVIEYRRDTGDILSFNELALVPGFSKENAEALRHFVVLRSSRAPGQTENRRLGQTLTLRGAVRKEDGNKTDRSVGLKYAAQWGEKAEFRWSTRTTYDDGSIKLGTMSAAIYGRRSLGKIVAGNFNARFGQGLAQWSGFILNGYSTVAAFRKNGTGLSPTGSYAPDLKGLGADWTWGHFTFTTAASLGRNNISAISNVSWTGRRATLGATCVWEAVKKSATVSADWRIGLHALSLFGEVAFKSGEPTSSRDLPAGVVAGAIWTPKYGTKVAVQGRMFAPSFKKDWSGAAVGFENPWMTATADAARDIAKGTNQFKSILQIKPVVNIDSLTTAKPSVRLNARYRPGEDNPARIDLRGDISLVHGSWVLNGRYNALWCNHFAWLWYAEAGHARRDNDVITASIYTRFSLFCIDNWDDRIYVYERDAPGSFNVPAYYGRGYAISLVGSLKRRRHTVHLRAGWTTYPWNITPKPSRFEFKAQYSLKIGG